MKKGFLFAAIGLVALASCSNEEEVQLNENSGISFQPVMDKATKAGVLDATNMERFKVTAVGNNAVYFTDLSVAGASSTWTVEKNYYWPSFDLTFYAYAPTGDTLPGTAAITESSQKISGVEIAAIARKQKDILIAKNKGTKASNEASGVPMYFKHALSQIIVKAKNSSTNYDVHVVGCKIANVKGTGEFTYPGGTTYTQQTMSAWTAAGLWNNNAASSSETWKCGTNVGETGSSILTSELTLNGDAQTIMFGADDKFTTITDCAYMLIPQKTTAATVSGTGASAKMSSTGSYISVLCRIIDKANKSLFPTEAKKAGGLYAYTAVPVDFTWEPNKKYVYTLDFSNGVGYKDPDTSKPGDDPDGPTPNPDPTGGGDGDDGKPVLGQPISFTVTVENWGTETNTDVEM